MGRLQSSEFTTSGTFIVPTGVTSVFVTLISGGGSGGSCIASNFSGGSGGGASEYCRRKELKVTSGASITVTIGSGGTTGFGFAGSPGTPSSFGTISCQGGYGGATQSISFPFISNGGGVGGGQIGDSAGDDPNGVPAVQGIAESKSFFGGSSGGGIPRNRFDFLPGAGCGPWNGGAGGSPDSGGSPGGGGGGSTIYGQGGAAGDGWSGTGPAHDGHSPSGFGGGGGGSGGSSLTTGSGGAGGNGYCLVQWVS